MEKIREALAKARSDKAFREHHPVADVAAYQSPHPPTGDDNADARASEETIETVEDEAGDASALDASATSSSSLPVPGLIEHHTDGHSGDAAAGAHDGVLDYIRDDALGESAAAAWDGPETQVLGEESEPELDMDEVSVSDPGVHLYSAPISSSHLPGGKWKRAKRNAIDVVEVEQTDTTTDAVEGKTEDLPGLEDHAGTDTVSATTEAEEEAAHARLEREERQAPEVEETPPMAVVDCRRGAEEKPAGRKSAVLLWALALLVGGGLAAFHVFFMPLDEAWLVVTSPDGSVSDMVQVISATLADWTDRVMSIIAELLEAVES